MHSHTSKNTRRLNSCNRSSAYTLLELLLSLALSVLVIGVIGFAIQLYLISLTQQQSRIERKQIARGLLQMISNDLRAAVQYKAADYGDLENLVQTQALALNAGIDELLAIEAANGVVSDTSNDLGQEELVGEESDLILDEEAAAFRPALFGTSNAIAVDVSRLPRLDQYNSIVASSESELQSPSDIKTLAYFFSNAPTRDDGVQFTNVASGGLYRRQIDRAVASYAGDSGLVDAPDDNSDLVAGEVAELRFRYFDGENWLSDWDSEALQGFPPAIEVVIVVDPNRSTSGEDYLYNGYNSAVMELYRSVIHLPAAELPLEEEE